MSDLLQYSDIEENLVIIKVNKLYKSNMSADELYEITRGIWKRKIDSVKDAKYCLSVKDKIVLEVYEIEQWYPAGTLPYYTRKIEKNTTRIEFSGHIANDIIREKYIGKSVERLYKRGEADPVKYIPVYKKDDFIMLDAEKNQQFSSIAEAINFCLGTDYSSWMKETWPNSKGNGKFRMWFPQLTKVKNGVEVSATNGCFNTISPDWNFFYFDDEKNSSVGYEFLLEVPDLIFARDSSNGTYVFRGLYMSEKGVSKPNHFVSQRIATRVKVFRNPKPDIEIDKTSRLDIDINFPVEPYSITNSSGECICTCSRCKSEYYLAPRCPECGQLIKTMEANRMNGYIKITAYEFWDYLRDKELNEINFWCKKKNISTHTKGDYIFFLRKNVNKSEKKEREIVGYGRYDHFEYLPIIDAWNKFGIKNGCDSLQELKNKVNNVFGKENVENIGCIVLTDVNFFEKSVLLSSLDIEFENSIVSGKPISEEETKKLLFALNDKND